MHGEREVDGRRALRQLNDVAGRGEDEDLVLVEVELEELEELVRRLRVQLHRENFAEPPELLVELVASLRGLLVQPVRGDSELRRAMHVARANLDLEQLLAGAKDRRMQRLVSVRFRLCDVILD